MMRRVHTDFLDSGRLVEASVEYDSHKVFTVKGAPHLVASQLAHFWETQGADLLAAAVNDKSPASTGLV